MNDHTMCNNPRCACSCHAAREAPPVPQAPTQSSPDKSCPKCGTKRPAYETFCRVDGSRLSSLACGICGAGREVEDLFCFKCGAPANAVGTVKVPQVGTVSVVDSMVEEK